MTFNIHKLTISKEKPGVISEDACWVCIYDCYFYTGDTFWLLLKDMWKWWNNDLRLIG